MSHNHYGLGFFKKSLYVSNPYNSFMKRKSDNSSKRIKNKFIWIPKKLSIVVKNTYIASTYMIYVIHAIMCILTGGNQI